MLKKLQFENNIIINLSWKARQFNLKKVEKLYKTKAEIINKYIY